VSAGPVELDRALGLTSGRIGQVPIGPETRSSGDNPTDRWPLGSALEGICSTVVEASGSQNPVSLLRASVRSTRAGSEFAALCYLYACYARLLDGYKRTY
jgi:hypothetical protein